jgi:glycosyltransferase involved in cell wall biosynthesis
MHRGVPVIASDQVGAAAGGLVVPERNGLVVPAGDVAALRAAIERLRDDIALRERLAAQARSDAAAYTPDAWAAGVEAALEDAGR